MTPAARSKYNRAYYAAHVEERRAYQEAYRKRNRNRLNATRRAKYSLDHEYRKKEKERKKVKRLEDMNMGPRSSRTGLFFKQSRVRALCGWLTMRTEREECRKQGHG